MEFEIEPILGLVLCVGTIFVGERLTERFEFLRRNYIPPAVTGGLMFSLLLLAAYLSRDAKITLDMGVRDGMLLVFFSTVGLTAKVSVLRTGGKALAVLVGIAAVFLVLQDAVGCLSMWLIGRHPAYGLFVGSVSLAGGHGTAIAWGEVAEEAGLSGARVLGIGCATFGLIGGGLIGGPVARRLIERHRIATTSELRTEDVEQSEPKPPADNHPLTSRDVLNTLLFLALCVGVGEAVNEFLFSRGVLLPGFLTAMLSGIVVTNLADVLGVSQSRQTLGLVQDVSLQLFLTLSMMGMELWSLFDAIGVILVLVVVQALVMSAYAEWVVFRLMGRDYDAVVIASGFAGLGMGATPVAIANMDTVTRRFGPSPKAFLIVPLVGAFFIDVLNAAVIRFFAGLPFMSG